MQLAFPLPFHWCFLLGCLQTHFQVNWELWHQTPLRNRYLGPPASNISTLFHLFPKHVGSRDVPWDFYISRWAVVWCKELSFRRSESKLSLSALQIASLSLHTVSYSYFSRRKWSFINVSICISLPWQKPLPGLTNEPFCFPVFRLVIDTRRDKPEGLLVGAEMVGFMVVRLPEPSLRGWPAHSVSDNGNLRMTSDSPWEGWEESGERDVWIVIPSLQGV